MLGPLTLQEIIDNTNQQPDFSDEDLEYRTEKFNNLVAYGQFKKGTNLMEGIFRTEAIDG